MKFIKNHWLLLVILSFIFRIIFSFLVWHPDVNNHVDWGIRFYDYGASEFYEPDSNVWSYTWPNQPPGTIYLYAAIYKLFEFVFNIFWQINIRVPVFPSIVITFFEDRLYQAMLQWPAILADFGLAYLIYKVIKQNFKTYGSMKSARVASLIFLINPVIWYNSSVWGQTDSIINFFVLLSFYLFFRNKPVMSAVAYALSLYLKISLLLFVPIYILIFIKKYRYNYIAYLKNILVPLLLIGALTLPFSKFTNPYSYLYYIYSEKVLSQQLHVITANAFNLWSAIAGIHERPHTQMLGPLSYQYWSYLIFGSIFVYLLIRLIKAKQNEMYTYKIIALTAFGSFLFLTNMHERYLYPLFPYFTIILFSVNLKWEYVTTSLVNLLNLYNFWWYPKVGLIVSFLSFGDRLMPRVLGVVNLVVFLFFYKAVVLKARKTT